ncbi:MAG: hypothetical protein HQM15_05175 [Deltaproteobacteria bacterium]|nr:hypothetical protein [Deltaproteobacteria bacterium]
MKNKKVFEMWASRFSSLGLPDADVELLKDFYKKLLDQGIAPFLKSNALYQEMLKDRMIIKTVFDQRDGVSKDVMLVKQLSHEDFSPSLFEIPKGFKQAKN